MVKKPLLSPDRTFGIFLGLSLLAQGGCVSHYPTDSDDLAEQSSLQASAPDQKEAAAGGAPTEATGQAQLAALVTKLSQVEGQLEEGDFEILSQLPLQVAAGSLEEAAKAIGSLHLAIQGRVLKGSAFEDAALQAEDPYQAQAAGALPPQEAASAGEQAAQAPPSSLEDWANALKVNLPAALAHNQYLKSYGVQVLALRALKVAAGPSGEFTAELTAAVRQNISLWSDLGKQLNPQESGAASEETLEDKPAGGGDAPNQMEDSLVAPALPFGSSEFANDEDLLKQGQTLVDEGKYQEAIKVLKRLDEKSLFHAAAKEKIHEASNLAVQELRRKAAKAFQSAIPVADRRARAAYLEEARRYLLTALDLYPLAEQIQTVKQNLSVINKNLDVLTASPSSN